VKDEEGGKEINEVRFEFAESKKNLKCGRGGNILLLVDNYLTLKWQLFSITSQ
jgi:hypothetical protein